MKTGREGRREGLEGIQRMLDVRDQNSRAISKSNRLRTPNLTSYNYLHSNFKVGSKQALYLHNIMPNYRTKAYEVVKRRHQFT